MYHLFLECVHPPCTSLYLPVQIFRILYRGVDVYAVVSCKLVSHLCGETCWNCVFPVDWGIHQTTPKTTTWTHSPKQICISGAVVLSRRALHFGLFLPKTEPNCNMLEVNTWYAYQRVLYSHRKRVAIWWSSGEARLFPGCNSQLCCVFDATNNVFFCGSEHECGYKRQPVKGCCCWLFVNAVWNPTYTHTPICFIVVAASSRVSSSTYRLESLYCINCYALSISILLTMHGGGFLHVWKRVDFMSVID